jgi:hypothetical protein
MEPPALEVLLALPLLTINLEYGDSDDRVCHASPVDRYQAFTAPSPQIEGFGFLELNVSVLVLPDNFDDWWNSPDSHWMRRKVRGAIKAGYQFAPFDHINFRDDVYEINTSKQTRQGRPMSEAYRRLPVEKSPFRNQSCPRHRNDYFGVFRDSKLYAYALVRQCGEMFLFAEFIGHGAHLENGIMNLLLFEAAKRRHQESGSRYAVYHLHHNGTPGLQFFKRKMGFAPHRVNWELARVGVTAPSLR